jgi:hypothetical protein
VAVAPQQRSAASGATVSPPASAAAKADHAQPGISAALQGHAIPRAGIAAPMDGSAKRDITVEYRPSIARFGAIRAAGKAAAAAAEEEEEGEISRVPVLAIQPKLRRAHTSIMTTTIGPSRGKFLTSNPHARNPSLLTVMFFNLISGTTIRITTPTRPSIPPPP